MNPLKYLESKTKKFQQFLEEYKLEYEKISTWFPQTIKWELYSDEFIEIEDILPYKIQQCDTLLRLTCTFEEALPLLEEIEIRRFGTDKESELNGLISDLIPCFLNLLHKIRHYQLLKLYLPEEIIIMEKALETHRTKQIEKMVNNVITTINKQNEPNKIRITQNR